MDILRVDGLPAVPWKNGGGITRAIAAVPAGADFDTADWRLDRSDIARAGPFSHLPGIDRLLLPLGVGLLLGFDGAAPEPRDAFLTVGFDGAASAACALAETAAPGGVQVLNLLLRRGRAAGRLLPFAGSGRLHEPGSAIVLYGARGGFTMAVGGGQPRRLDAGQAAVHDGSAGVLAFEPYRPWSMLVAAVVRPTA
jgi:environmental stress-induced protein Ves